MGSHMKSNWNDDDIVSGQGGTHFKQVETQPNENTAADAAATGRIARVTATDGTTQTGTARIETETTQHSKHGTPREDSWSAQHTHARQEEPRRNRCRNKRLGWGFVAIILCVVVLVVVVAVAVPASDSDDVVDEDVETESTEDESEEDADIEDNSEDETDDTEVVSDTVADDEDTSDDSEDDEEEEEAPTSTPVEEWEQGVMPYLYQTDPQYADIEYCGGTLETQGCGPFALAMVYIYLTGNTDMGPVEMAEFATEYGYATDGSGTEWALISEGCTYLGLTSTSLAAVPAYLEAELEAGNPIICVMDVGTFTDVGHFIVLVGLDEDGNAIIRDSNSEERSHQTWSLDLICDEAKAIWSISLA